MDWSTLAEAAPELVIGFGMLAAVAWFRKQDREQMASVRAEVRSVRLSALPPGELDDGEATATGKHRAVVIPWDRLSEQINGLDQKVDDEIAESRKFRESHASRVTALETDVKWLRRGKGRDDTYDDRRKK